MQLLWNWDTRNQEQEGESEGKNILEVHTWPATSGEEVGGKFEIRRRGTRN